MKKVVIVGCGLAGLTAARKLAGRGNIDLTLIDGWDAFAFKPLLPDIIGDRTPPEALTYILSPAAESMGARFVQAEATGIDATLRRVSAGGEEFDYDYAIIATGAETIFHGRDDLRPFAHRLDSAPQAEAIIHALDAGNIESAVVAGGGYTGVEATTNLRAWSHRRRRRLRIILIEKGPMIMPGLPDWIREYCAGNMRRLDIELSTGTSIDSMNGATARLSDGRAIENALLVWSAGQRAARFAGESGLKRDAAGRLEVDEYLRAADGCFAAGDAAGFIKDGRAIRFSAQFACAGGALAAGNILREMAGRPMKPFGAFDPGFIIPMGNNLGCGRIFGFNVRGPLPVWMQFLACSVRSPGWPNKLAVFKALTRNLKTF